MSPQQRGQTPLFAQRIKCVALTLVVLSGAALADPDPVLILRREPVLRHLRMRPRVLAQLPPPAPRPKIPMPAAPTVSATQPEPIDGLDGIRDVRQPVSFSLNLGYQVDGARPSGRAGIGSTAPMPGRDYSTLRSYGFGEAFLSTRGVGLASLETYFAVRFQAARKVEITNDPAIAGPTSVAIPSPIATWFERSGYEFRTGWAEVKDFLPRRLGLKNVRIRAGDQFVYGPWILHMDGLYATYEGPTVTAALYGGPRHSDYPRDQSPKRPVAGGLSLRIDLRGVTRKFPLAVTGELLGLTASSETGEDKVDTSLLQVDWRPRPDIVVIGQQRAVNGQTANQRLEVRTRYKQVTNFVFDVMRRYAADWRWDPSLVSRPTQDTTPGDMTEARRYLDLGPVLPQVIASARAGTLIRENIDLLARFAIATDLQDPGQPVNTFSSPYVELGGALEVRLRRQAALGFSALSRQSKREIPAAQILDNHGPIDPLPKDTTLGEQGFLELGTSLKMTLGARRFSAMVEVYGRNTRYSIVYRDPIAPLPQNDVRGGGRFTVDSWVGRRVRLFVSYDVSSALDTAPDINGYKSLKLVLSGVY